MMFNLKLIIGLQILLLATKSFANQKILVLWDSSEVIREDYTLSVTHQKIEVLFNHMGMQLDYLDINKPIPQMYFEQKTIQQYLGLFSWLTDTNSLNPIKHMQLIKSWSLAGKKIAMLGYPGFSYDQKGNFVKLEIRNQLFKLLGAEFTDSTYSNQLILKPTGHTKASDFEFERTLENEIPDTIEVFASSNRNKKILSISNTLTKKSSDVIFYNNKFFYVARGFELFINPIDFVSQWRINPYLITKWFYGNKLKPIADTTTLFGKRIWYSHIDGDAFVSVSEIDRKSYCGSIIRQEIIEKYDLPVSASFVTAEIDPRYGANKRITDEVKKIMALKNIEIASHTFTHPLSWMQNPDQHEILSYKEENYKSKGPIVAYSVKSKNILDYREETIDSIHFINSLSENKNANILFWTGSCKPPYEALKILSENNIKNINGGDSRFDSRYPSLSHLYPLYRAVDDLYQVYSSNSNENTYTNLWSGPYSGYKDVIETFQNTENPIRLKPINIYYHFYSGEKKQSLKALKEVIDWSLTQNIFPVFTSEYVDIVGSFKDFKFVEVTSNHFEIKNGKIRTVRFPTTKFIPNYNLSKNIIGHSVFQGNLYIYLGDNAKSILHLTDTVTPKFYIEESNVFVNNWSSENQSVKISLKPNTTTQLKIFSSAELALKAESHAEITKVSPLRYRLMVPSTQHEIEIKVKQ